MSRAGVVGGCLSMTGEGIAVHRPVRFVLWWYRLVLVGAFGFFAVLLLSMLSSDRSNPAAVAFLGAVLVPMVMVAVRAWRVPTIEMGKDGFVIRGLLRTRRIRWSEVQRVEVGRGTSAALLAWRVPSFELKDGSTVCADEIRSLRDRSIVDDVVAEARRWIDRS